MRGIPAGGVGELPLCSGIDPLWAIVATLLAAQPVGVSVFIFADRYNTAQAMATTSVFLSTTFSVISIPVLLYLIDFTGCVSRPDR